MTDQTLRATVRRLIPILDAGGMGAVPQVIAELKAAGAVNGVHAGDATIQGDPQKTLEWYAGQILDVLEGEHWFAVNSLVNCCDKFAPEKP